MDFEAHNNRLATVAAGYLSNHHVLPEKLGEVLNTLNNELLKIAFAGPTVQAPPEAKAEQVFEPKTPSQIRNSVRPDGITSFIDGKPYKALRRHLTTHGLTPEEYRARYGLPPDYPLVAAEYAERRSELAKALGLGQQRRKWPSREGEPPASHETEVRPSHED